MGVSPARAAQVRHSPSDPVPLTPRPSRRVNDSAALGRNTAGDDNTTSEELETVPMLVEGLQDGDFPFKAIRVAGGDSISLAVGDHGELRCWGSYRVSFTRSCI